jgi:hypothetical protein
MRYQQFVAEGLPIGSGVVEAACKTLVTQRMKQSGMRWRQEGGRSGAGLSLGELETELVGPRAPRQHL